MKQVLAAWVSVCVLWPQWAEAGGFYTPPHGVRTMGRGGAGVLAPPDMNALWYNPALLAGIDGTHIMIDLTFTTQSVDFQRAPRLLPNGEVRTYEQVSNEAALLTIPQLGFASDFGFENLVFALGAWAPNGATGNYPEDGPQRYTLVDNEGSFILHTELAVAVKVADWLWLGGGFQNTFVTLNLINVVSGFPGTVGDPEDPDFDILLKTELASAFNPSLNMGIRAEAMEGVQFGLSLQTPIHVEDTAAKVTTRLPSSALFDDAVSVGNTVAGSFDLPMVIRAGARYEAPTWDIELDVAVEFWSIFDEIKTSPKDIEIQNVPGIGTIAVGALNIPRQYEDIFSVRLGGDWQVIPEVLSLRAGGLYEQTAIPSKTLSVLSIDTDKLALGLGGSWQMTKTVALDVGYAHVFYLGGDVRDSIVKQLNPTNEDGAITVGNGQYTASTDLLGLGVRFDF